MIEILLWSLAAFAGMLVLVPTAVAKAKAPPVKRGANRVAAQEAAGLVTDALAWPELESFLDAAAYTESGWHPSAGSQRVGTNGAIGLWQVRPTSGFPTQGAKKEWTRDEAIALGGRLLDPKVNAVAIGNYLLRLRGWNPDATLGELRAGMVYPVFVKGRPTGLAPAGKLRKKFPTAAAWADRFDRAVAKFETAIAESGVDVNPNALANFPEGPIPLVSELAAQIGAQLE